MKCLYCGSEDSKVIDSRACEELNAIRRRRECLSCGRRFNTYETIELVPIIVVKSNGTRERFSTTKVKNGILKAELHPKQKVSLNINDIESFNDFVMKHYLISKIGLKVSKVGKIQKFYLKKITLSFLQEIKK